MELETKERRNLGRQGRKRAKEGVYFFNILLIAAGERNIHTMLVQPHWCSQVFITASVKEEQTVFNLSDCCYGHGLYLLHFCLSHCFMVHLAELFIQNNVRQALYWEYCGKAVAVCGRDGQRDSAFSIHTDCLWSNCAYLPFQPVYNVIIMFQVKETHLWNQIFLASGCAHKLPALCPTSLFQLFASF